MDKQTLRRYAIKEYLSGNPVSTICQQLNVSRKWFYKWYKRYQNGREGWYKDQPKIAKTIPNKLDASMEELILSIRDRLEQSPYAQKGASAIARQINKLGHTPPPHWTINRVLKRNDRIHKRPSKRERKHNPSYPYFTEAYYPEHIHHADLAGPKYLKGEGRFYAFNTIDVFSHSAHSVITRSKDDDSVVGALIDTWKQLGIPEYLVLDNELSFRGSNRYPHSFGKVIKLCLSMNIQPVFIPLGEPWRNGIIERFNQTFAQRFYRTERFRTYEHLKGSLKQFIDFHNSNHIYANNGGKTPREMLENEGIKTTRLNNDYRLPEHLSIPYEGYIHLIRFIRSDLKLNIWGERFPMPKELMYQYVRATIFTESHVLNVFLSDKLVCQFEYRLPTLNQENPREMLREMNQLLNDSRLNFTVGKNQ